ncbi:MAG: hypothetical protein IE917_17360 [Betaproteobacteria bacterium]|nr:hypothetical protein [Betaproteobacteria bacterium]
MNIFLTIISGVAVFVLGQIFLKLVIDPIQEAKKTIARIRIELIRNGHVLHNANAVDKELKDKLFESFRSLAAELIAATEIIPFYKATSKVAGLPSNKKMRDASRNLIALSNWMFVNHDKQIGHILKNNDELADNLGFKIDPGDRVSKEAIAELIKY